MHRQIPFEEVPGFIEVYGDCKNVLTDYGTEDSISILENGIFILTTQLTLAQQILSR